MNDFFCLMLSGMFLTDDIRNFLYDTALDMYLNTEDQHRFSNRHAEGVIQTDWVGSGMADVWGILFTAHIENDRGETQVTYIVGLKRLEREKRFWLSSQQFGNTTLS